MPHQDKIEEQVKKLAKIAHRFIACGQPDCEGCEYENNELISEIRTTLLSTHNNAIEEAIKTVESARGRTVNPPEEKGALRLYNAGIENALEKLNELKK